MKKTKLYEMYHAKSRNQHKIISEKNFTYVNIIPLLNKCLVKKVRSILDIGCGSGTMSLYLASKGYKVKGIDISKKAISVCNKSAKSIGLKNVDFEISDFPKKIPKEKFDLVYFSEVIEHLPDDEMALRKINKLLNPNGILFLSTPSKNAPLYKLGMVKEFDEEVGHLRRYSEKELKIKLIKTGFRVQGIYKKEGILRNFLFINPIAGKSIRFIKFFLVDIFTHIDNFLTNLLGESQIIIISSKNSSRRYLGSGGK